MMDSIKRYISEHYTANPKTLTTLLIWIVAYSIAFVVEVSMPIYFQLLLSPEPELDLYLV